MRVYCSHTLVTRRCAVGPPNLPPRTAPRRPAASPRRQKTRVPVVPLFYVLRGTTAMGRISSGLNKSIFSPLFIFFAFDQNRKAARLGGQLGTHGWTRSQRHCLAGLSLNQLEGAVDSAPVAHPARLIAGRGWGPGSRADLLPSAGPWRGTPATLAGRH